MFMGEYNHTIDEKGRITIPSKIREQLGEEFVITRGMDKCLFVYPKKEWEKVIDKYKELPNTKDARNFMRFFLSGASISEFDKQGRINIANPLKNYADLKKECVIIGVNERLEILDKEAWNIFLEQNEENFSDIADKLFNTEI
jgi:MraZ protein